MNFKKNKKGLILTPKCSACKHGDKGCEVRRASNPDSSSAKLRAKGLTFIELMMATFIFALMMLAVTGIFSSSISGYQKAKNVQKNLEDAQFIMNQITKNLRTSSILYPDVNGITSEIKIYEYSAGKCYKYILEDNMIKVGSYSEDIEGKTLDQICLGSFSPEPMAAFHVEEGHFYATKSEAGDDISGVLGKATLSISICQSPSSCEKDRVRIQSSASLKDYYNAGI